MVPRHGFVAFIAAFAAAGALAHPAADWYDALVEADLRRPEANFSRAAAIAHAAMFDAVNAIERRYRPYRPPPNFEGPASASAAAHAAAHAVLRELYPASRDALDRRLAEALGEGDAIAVQTGRLLGVAVAGRLLAERVTDRWDTPESYRPHTSPGRYVPTAIPVAASVASLRPFVIAEPAMFRPPPPYRLESPEWARDFNEVKALGGHASAIRTPEQARRSRFMAISHPRLFGQAVAGLLRDRAPQLLEGCRLMFLFTAGMADAFLASFEAKYHYAFWRPITAIRNGDIDGNDDTLREAGWRPLLDVPMHPEYPCQHCVSAALTSAVLRTTFGERPFFLVLRNPAFPEPMAVAVDELPAFTSEARVNGGLHFRASTVAGMELGRRVAEQVLRAAPAEP